MGMFDTFVGSVVCPHCGNETHFSEQTKNYECLLQDFKVGDYVDKADENYFYEFNYPCMHCKQDINIYAGIRRGQLVGYYTNVDDINVNELSNVEENHQRNIEYRMMCITGYGFEQSDYSVDSLIGVGDVIHVLDRDWKVKVVYEEQIRKGEDNNKLLQFWIRRFKRNRCYQVQDTEGNERLIVVREHEPVFVTGLPGCADGNPYSVYVGQLGTDIVKVQ